MEIHPDDRIIRDDTLRHMLGDVSRMTLWRLRQNDPDFPEHFQTTPNGPNCTLLSAVMDYIKRKAVAGKAA
jgi:hypothetical protein